MKRCLSVLLLTLVVVVTRIAKPSAAPSTAPSPTHPAAQLQARQSSHRKSNRHRAQHCHHRGRSYAFQDIPLGAYSVNVVATGFSGLTVDNVAVSAGQVYTLPISLKIGQSATTVEVSAAAVTLDTTTATQNMTISSDVVQDVPLNGRDFTQLIA